MVRASLSQRQRLSLSLLDATHMRSRRGGMRWHLGATGKIHNRLFLSATPAIVAGGMIDG